MSSAMTEFKITSDLSAIRQQVIEANFEEVREWLDENLAPYRSMVVTEDMIPTAKTYRASIRKVKDRIEQSRKEAKTAAMAAYAPFEVKCKELTGLCDEAASAIDEQVKAFEEREKQEKLDAIRKEYDALATGEVSTYCTWERVFNPKWGNKGYSAEDAIKEITDHVTATKNALTAIRSMGGDDTAYLLDYFAQTYDLSAVISKASDLRTRRAQEEQRKREEEERRRAAKEAEAVEKAAEAAHEPVVQKPAPTDDMVTVDFRVTCRRSQLQMLGQYMRQAGIRYGRISD